MEKVRVIYGSTTGMTEAVAQRVAEGLGTTAVNVSAAGAADFEAEILVLGTSTWGCGDMQDDWAANGVALLEGAAQGKKVAVFGLGDAVGFADTFCAAAQALADTAVAHGATLVGEVVKIDETNDAAGTDAKVAALVAAVKAA